MKGGEKQKLFFHKKKGRCAGLKRPLRAEPREAFLTRRDETRETETSFAATHTPRGQSPPRWARAGFTYHTDSLGSVVELSNENGASVGSYRYDPNGDSLDSGAPTTNQADSNPIRFSGQYLDSDSGLYDLRARECDPFDGRFLETDPADPGSSDFDLSDYLYAEDDPIRPSDPSDAESKRRIAQFLLNSAPAPPINCLNTAIDGPRARHRGEPDDRRSTPCGRIAVLRSSEAAAPACWDTV